MTIFIRLVCSRERANLSEVLRDRCSYTYGIVKVTLYCAAYIYIYIYWKLSKSLRGTLRRHVRFGNQQLEKTSHDLHARRESKKEKINLKNCKTRGCREFRAGSVFEERTGEAAAMPRTNVIRDAKNSRCRRYSPEILRYCNLYDQEACLNSAKGGSPRSRAERLGSSTLYVTYRQGKCFYNAFFCKY